MAFRSRHIIARLLWFFPLALLLLALHQGKTAYDIQQTAQHGTDAQAEVLLVHQEDRVDVTYDYVNLRVHPPEGESFVVEKLSLPHSLINEMEGQDQVAVKVNPGAAQPVVIADFARPQSRIALVNALMSFVLGLLAGVGVFAWNRYLTRRGDPADQEVRDDDAEHPAGWTLRASS